MISSPPPFRSVRSYVCRGGKLPLMLEQIWQRNWPKYGLSLSSLETDLNTLFNQNTVSNSTERVSAEKVLEIGFGDGNSLVEMAAHFPEKDFIGVEVYRRGIAKLLERIEDLKLTNIRVFCQNAEDVLFKLPNDSLSRIQIFFADPWPKTRHHKRRLIQEGFVHLALLKLQDQGTLHLATDWADYAHHMMSVISNNNHFHNIAGVGQFSARPDYRPITKYERRGLKLGHCSYDLIFQCSK